MHLHGHRRGFHRILPFLKGFYGLAKIPTIFWEQIDETLEFKHPAWLDDIIIVTKGSAEKHGTEVKETMKKLEEAGYRLNPEKCEFFKKEAEWIGHKIDRNGKRPLQDKLEAITKVGIPKNEKELKSKRYSLRNSQKQRRKNRKQKEERRGSEVS